MVAKISILCKVPCTMYDTWKMLHISFTCMYLWVEVTLYFLAVYEATHFPTSCITETSSWNSPCDVFCIVVPFFANALWNIWSLKVAEVLSDTCMFYGMSVISRCGDFNVIGFFVTTLQNSSMWLWWGKVLVCLGFFLARLVCLIKFEVPPMCSLETCLGCLWLKWGRVCFPYFIRFKEKN